MVFDVFGDLLSEIAGVIGGGCGAVNFEGLEECGATVLALDT